MRLFVGTLYTIENEFDECVASIKRQSYRNFQHFVFRNLPNKEAHDALYSAFMERASEFDLLIKVDADMVIEDKDLFARIVNKFYTLDSLKDLEIAVYDFFSDQLIWGMHAYRNTIRWQQTDEVLFVDACPVKLSENIHDDFELAPAAIHSKNPGRFQSFHYGVHKAVKIMQPARTDKKPSRSKYHWDIIQKTWNHFITNKDVRLGLAVLGAEFAFHNKLQPVHLDYTNPYCHNHFIEYENYDFDQIFKEIKRIRNWNWGFLPGEMRRDVLSYLEGGHMLQISAWPRLLKGFARYLQLKLMV